MPNREIHVQAGIAAGGLIAAWRARHAPSLQFVAETLGGVAGGALGGALPDVLEPATSPRHRDIAHSAAAVAALAFVRVAELQAQCREQAAHFDQLATAVGVEPAARNDAELKALLWRFAAGLLVGLVAGYVSHVVLDARTPGGITICGRWR